MRIIHRFGLRVTDQERKPFQEIGLDLPEGVMLPGGGALIAFEVTEDDPRWNDVLTVLGERKKLDLVWTEFSPVELNAATFLVMHAKSPIGYPQPEKQLGYLDATYDLTNRCVRCGVGLKQKAPFRFKSAPTLRNKSIFQLYWILDDFFATTEIWESVFKPLGIGGSHPVVNKTGAEIQSVVQLDIQSVCDVNTEGFDPQDCSVCGRRKYKFLSRGYCPEPVANDFAMAKSSQYFGEGTFARKLVIVSDELYRKIKESDVKGVEFYPCSGAWIQTIDYAQLKDEPLTIRPTRVSKALLTGGRLKIVELIKTLEDEVNNGGFDQFFYNSAGDNTAEIIRALETIGAGSMADIVKRAAAKFPGGMPPKDRFRRQDILLEIFPERDAFEEMDGEFYEYPDDLADLLQKYVSD
jgi:hypothetical protein